MASSTYSTYEAKAKFSEILRKVRAGESVVVTYRGREVAEIRPMAQAQTPAARYQQLIARGAIARAGSGGRRLEPLASRPGAVQRFLESRD